MDWSDDLLLLVTDIGGCNAAIDSSRADPGAPVYYLERVDRDDSTYVPAARSIGEMVTWWIEGIDAGVLGYDANRKRWDMKEWPGFERNRLVN